MKRKSIFLAGALLIVFVLAVVGVSKASATTGCFNDTNGHWAETFICWMSDNGISGGVGGGNYAPEGYVTRAQMAVFMQALRTTGDTHINAGPSNWVPNGTGSHYTVYYGNTAHLKSPGAGSYFFNMMPSIPSSMLNAKMYLEGAKVCFDATHGATIDDIRLIHYSSFGSEYQAIANTNPYTSETCVTLNFASPMSLWGGEWAAVSVHVNFPSASDYVRMYGVTLIVSPSPYPPVLGPESGLRPDVEIPTTTSPGADQ